MTYSLGKSSKLTKIILIQMSLFLWTMDSELYIFLFSKCPKPAYLFNNDFYHA